MARSAVILAASVVLTTSCVSSKTNRCGDLICPDGTVCVPTLGQCYSDDSVAQCRNRDDGEPCTGVGIVEGTCRLGVCVDSECGDGIVSGSEDCEGDEVGSATCSNLDFYGGELACGVDCRYNTSGCVGFCGDGVTNGPEECDGPDLPKISCLEFGFDGGKIGCSSICSTSFSSCERFGWSVRDSGTGDYFEDIWGTAPDSMYGVGRNGMFRFYDGQTWSAIQLADATAAWRAIDGSAANNAWAVGNLGQVARLDDAGWTLVDIGTTEQLYDVAVQAVDDVWVVGRNATALHYNGTTWTAVDIGAPADARLKAISIAGDAVAIGGRTDAGGVVYLNEGKGVWQEILGSTNFGPVRDVELTATDDIWITQKWSGGPKHWDGNSWTTVALTNAYNCHDVLRRAADDILVSCGGSGRPIYHYDGNAWVNLEFDHFGTARQMLNFGDEYFAVGSRGVFARFDGRGYLRRTYPVLSYTSVSAVRRDAVFASHSQGVAVYNGQTWTNYTTGQYMRQVVATGPDTAIAAGSGTDIFKFANGAWTVDHTLTALSYVYRASANTPKNIWLLGTGKDLAHFDGQTWTEHVDITLPSTSIAVAAFGADQAWVGSYYGGLNFFDGQSWTPDTRMEAVDGAHIRALGGASATDLYAGTDVGLYHFDGADWTKVDGLPDTNAFYRWVVSDAPDNVYVGVSVGQDRLYHFDGTEWTRIRSRLSTPNFAALAPDTVITANGVDIDILVDVR